ncbi:CWF19-like protein 2 [Notothenia coriiceps]|uniref:CWF19-like protein 2 n=1 Tax=Notothenia coriiceps TaxID=8208 RepID=A0A6I9N4T4_9TELE|nr:PREDICTED: CWF19-like protein 2 [Notothenia coriiceps]
MAEHVVSFESKGSIEERKHSKREARQEVIDKAKEQYDKAERRKELKRQRGEDTWMLPEINQRLQEMEEAGLHKLELNPFWKDGGTGLPPAEKAATKKGNTVVNDAGLGWLRKSFQRMKEQAERQQRSLNEIVAERYGSMEEFQQKLADAEIAVYGHCSGGDGNRGARGGWRRGGNESRERWRRNDGEGEERERWRRNERERDSSPTDGERDNAGRREERERGGYRGREEDRSRDGDRFRDRERVPDRRRPPARPSSGFLKPSSDDEDSGPRNAIMQTSKKSSNPTRESASFEKPQQERERDPGKPVPLIELTIGGQRRLLKKKLQAMVEKLKSQLDAAHKAKESHEARRQEMATSKQVTGRSSEAQELLLFRTDQSGRAWPVNAPSGPQEPHGGRRKKKAIETHVDGERVRYFQDDDSTGLKEMVRREKMSSAQDQNALYSRMASKMMGKTDGDNYTLDDMFVSSAAQREGEGREEERMRSKAIGESRRLNASMERCRHCFSSRELQKHLVVAIGSKVYLSVPAGVSMTEGHCHICPLQHHCSATGLDEDVWSEMQLFRRTLVRMFESQELDCVFMETHMDPRKRQHMVLECLPLPRELGDMAPIYFKKAILDCDEEWAMNKKVVDLSSKDIRHAVPRGLPYFAVDFGLQGGFAHVIENEHKFPHYFGKEVVGGMMDLEPRRWRKMIRENFDDQRKKVLEFAGWWKPYDCTKTAE